jgi:hypothetical protein
MHDKISVPEIRKLKSLPTEPQISKTCILWYRRRKYNQFPKRNVVLEKISELGNSLKVVMSNKDAAY